VPARYASTRFPGKPLAPILGKPMIQWVYERATQVHGMERVLVATDDRRIAAAVARFGGEAVMTSDHCASGSDRVWEAVKDLDCDVVVNLQGDEPTLEPASVQALLDLMASNPDLELGTLVAPLIRPEDFRDPNVVKVVLGAVGRCLYFSRSPVPHLRERAFEAVPLWRHVGVYAFRKALLEAFTGWPRGTLEATESLEQLRALERGITIKAAAVEWSGCAVDTPEDVAAAEAYLIKQGPSR
jgi:3-deoxy-D-manno-octulosonate cytidylyltransferase